MTPIDESKYPPLPEHAAEALHLLELMLRGSWEMEPTEAAFDKLCKQAKHIDKIAHGDPIIRDMTIAAYDALGIKAGRPGAKEDAQNVTYACQQLTLPGVR